ncbi:MAG: low specificity L-threonine aldolase [Bacteroidaceae bacterium]|nr:low specificity L-threonine aldolase [Bacteroidaceae bacterium]
MIQFQCDYNEGCAQEILDLLIKTNMEQHVGYGEDAHCEKARQLIRQACERPEADVHFLVGGTQANATVISSILRPHQGVIAASTGHIAVHETGAIEHSGHKVLALQACDGKIMANQIKDCLIAHQQEDGPEHMVQPGMVYISYPTEYGTLYSRKELEDISRICHDFQIPLFIDGARLGYGLTSHACDLTLPQLAHLADVFSIGGTKQGALFGEAVVIQQPCLKKDFRYFIKQGGGMLAKGRLLGIQFEALMTNNLYFRLARHANEMAVLIREAFQQQGFEEAVPSPTNQLFYILPNDELKRLEQQFILSPWAHPDAEHTIVRFCTSWATKPENVQALISAIQHK